MLVCFNTLSANTRAQFENEANYMDFQKLMQSASRRVEFVAANATYSVAQANEMIRAQMNKIFGLDYKNSNRRDRRRAYENHKHELFALIEDTILDRMNSGWGDNPFFTEWVQYRNLMDGDKNEFYVPDTSLLQVSKFAGNHHDLDRQKILPGRAFSVPTSWYGIKVYSDWEEFAMVRIDWADMIDRMYRSVNQARMDAIYTMFSQLKTIAPTDMKLDVNTSSTTVNQIVELAELVKSVAGYDVALIGTRVALNKLTAMTQYDAWSGNMKDEKNNTGMLGHWEGYQLVAIPRVNAYGTHTEVTDSKSVLIMPVDPEFKPIIVVNEGDVMYYEQGANRELHDMTVEAELAYQEGVALVANQAFGHLNITA